MTWTVGASAAALAFGALAWEAVAGPASPLRWTGYAAIALGLVGVAAYAALRWFEAPPSAAGIADRLEGLFPQARGRVRDALAGAGAGLAAERVDRARAWMAGKGADRLDAALAAGHGVELARIRAVAGGFALLALLTVAIEPGAARRAAATAVDPGGLWRGTGAWRVEPGDATVRVGDDVDGRAAFRGPDVGDAPLVLEWRRPDGAWRLDTLGFGPTGAWRWTSIEATRRYRLRRGPFQSPEFAIEVDEPFALVELEARRGDGAWGPWSGFGARAGDAIEVRGSVNEPVVRAVVRLGSDREIPLDIEETTFSGRAVTRAGPVVVVARTADGRVVTSPPIEVAPAGRPFVAVLRPSDDPASLDASSAWLEVRAAAPDGLDEIRWEREDGAGGRLAALAGARDTIASGVAALGDGAAPGDTVRYRVVAVPLVGRPAASPWRRAVVPSAAAIREEVRGERARASRAVERAVSDARRAAEEALAAVSTDGSAPEEAERANRALEAASDSLGRALGRTLADPDLPAEVRERLEAYRSLLEELEAFDPADPRPGAGPDPAAEAAARADLLDELVDRIAEAEARLERARAGEDLERLADSERALADETRATPPEGLEAAVGARQRELAADAREALERAGAGTEGTERAREALDRAAEAIEAGEPAEAADAQEDAAGALSTASSEARRSGGGDPEEAAERRAALERAGGEALFLAERQREVAARLDRATDEADEHADRRSRQRVVSRGLERTLGVLVEAIGGTPARGRLPELLARAVYETRRAEREIERAPREPVSGMRGGRSAPARAAAADAADALGRLARALLNPSAGGGSAGGAGGTGESGAVAQGLQELAEDQASVADAAGATGRESGGGDPEAAAAQRDVARGIGEVADEAEAAGLDRRAMDALAREAEAAAARLERGLAGARTESELRSLSRRLSDLGRTIGRDATERRRSETARGFVPADPSPLPERATAPVIDPEAAMAGWETVLPRRAVESAREYLERLAEDGVREQGSP